MKAIFAMAAMVAMAGGSALAETRDDWGRRKDCAAQAEKFEARNRAEMKADGLYNEQSYEHHYSPEYGRCYVEADYQSHYGEKTTLERRVLWDAYDGQVEASMTGLGGGQWVVTYISGEGAVGQTGQPDVTRVEAYISDHMTR